MREEPAVGILTLVCKTTGAEISTGVIYHRDDLARTKKAQLLLHCRTCGKTHLFKFSDARLEAIRLGREEAVLESEK